MKHQKWFSEGVIIFFVECVMESHRRNTGLKTQKPTDKSTKPKNLKIDMNKQKIPKTKD